MKYFNLYYKDSKINSIPLTETEVNEIFSSNKKISKSNPITKEINEIPLNKIQIVKTFII